jgi:hypothetical protein
MSTIEVNAAAQGRTFLRPFTPVVSARLRENPKIQDVTISGSFDPLRAEGNAGNVIPACD